MGCRRVTSVDIIINNKINDFYFNKEFLKVNLSEEK